MRPAQSLNKTLKTGRQNIVYGESVYSALRRQGLSHENAVEEINELKYPDVYTCDVGKLFEEIWQTLEEGSDYDEAEMETIVDTHLKERYEQDCNKPEPHSPGPLDETASDCDENYSDYEEMEMALTYYNIIVISRDDEGYSKKFRYIYKNVLMMS